MSKHLLFINIRSYDIERLTPLYAAKDLGHKVTLVCNTIPKNIPQELVDHYLVTDTFNIPASLEVILNYQQTNPIDAVLTWIDKDVELVALVGNALGLKTLSIDASKKVRNKYLMRKAIGSESKYCPRFVEIKSYTELFDGIKQTGLPAILKPVGASGSHSIYKITNSAELEAVYQQLLESTKPQANNVFGQRPNLYILEEYMPGDEISIDGYIDNGNIHIAGVTDKEVTPDYSLEYNALFPSKYIAPLSKQIQEITEYVINKLELDNCPFHLECRVHNNEIKVIEIAGRCGGGFITSHLMSLSRKQSYHQVIINNALQNSTQESKSFPSFVEPTNLYVGMVDPISNKTGKIIKEPNYNAIIEDRRVLYVLPKKKVGDLIIQPPANFHPNLGAILVQTPSYADLKKLLEYYQELYISQIEVEEDVQA